MKRLLPLLALLALPAHHGWGETTLGTAITSVPYPITKAGVYHFTKDLTFSAGNASAIDIGASDVVIDLNAHVLDTLAGSGNTIIGIKCDGFNRVTIKDGVIRGFQSAVVLTGSGTRVSDLLVTNNYGSGITLVGNDNQVVHNRVCNTGGAANASFLYAIGINVSGTDCTVADNDVQNTFASDNTGHFGDGIRINGCANIVVSNNRVLDVEPSAPVNGGISTGIVADSTAPSGNLIFLGNIVVTSQTGFDLSGGSSGKYGDNITGGVSTGYNTSGSGMTDVGNNN